MVPPSQGGDYQGSGLWKLTLWQPVQYLDWINIGLQSSLLQVLLHMGTYSHINREKEKLNLLPKTNTQLLNWKLTRWEVTSNGTCDTWKTHVSKADRNGPTGDHLKFSFLMLFARKNWQSQPQETVLIAVKLAHTQKVKLLEAFSLPVKIGQGRGAYFIPTSYSVDIICNLFGYMKHILILTPQFSEVLHPFQYKVSDILSTWMHT